METFLDTIGEAESRSSMPDTIALTTLFLSSGTSGAFTTVSYLKTRPSEFIRGCWHARERRELFHLPQPKSPVKRPRLRKTSGLKPIYRYPGPNGWDLPQCCFSGEITGLQGRTKIKLESHRGNSIINLFRQPFCKGMAYPLISLEMSAT
jgi:hypothetical protein